MPYADNPFLNRGLASTTLHPMGLEVSHAQGPWIHLSDGTRLFDAISGIGVTNFGHGNETVKGHLQAQLDRHLHTMVYGENCFHVAVVFMGVIMVVLAAGVFATFL